MDVPRIVLGIVLLALLAFAVRWQFDRTMDKVTNADDAHAFPVSTPLTSPLCGPDGQKCKDLSFDSGFDFDTYPSDP